MASPTPDQWAASLLKRLNIPQSSGALQALVGWEKAEGGNWNNDARYNPLNTTQGAPGAGNTGAQGNIKAYTSWGQGLNATVQTLKNGRYNPILSALKQGDPSAVASAIGQTPWGTSGGLVRQTILGTKAPSSASPIGGSGGGGTVPINSPTNAPTTSGSSGGDDANAAALLALLGQQGTAPRPASTTPLPTPAATAGPAMPTAYQALTSGSGPAPKDSGLSAALAQNAATPGQAAANVAAQASPLVADASSGGTSAPADATGGAQAALGWATSKVGFKETGTNSGGLASYLNDRFGMSNQPWCAMFTSAAVTKGGAPASARTASVAEVRRQAQTGDGGYEKGFVDASNAKPGDLILFGDRHVGMVRSVKDGQVNYVGGNQSNGVTVASTPVGSGDIVRPKYGARKR